MSRPASPVRETNGGNGATDVAIAQRASSRVLDAVKSVDPNAKITSVIGSTTVSGCPDGVLIKIIPSVGGELTGRILAHLRVTWPLIDVASSENHLDGGIQITVHLPTQEEIRYIAAQEARSGAMLCCLWVFSMTLMVTALALVLFIRFAVPDGPGDRTGTPPSAE